MEQARRTVVKAWFGIGDSLDNKTGFRVSLSQGGSTTSPWLTYVDYLHVYANRLRGVIIENLDYCEVVRRYDKHDTLFYFDPPYVLDSRSRKHAYKHDWCDDDHLKFIDLVLNIKGKAVISGYETDLYQAIPWPRVDFKATSQSGERIECLWIKK